MNRRIFRELGFQDPVIDSLCGVLSGVESAVPLCGGCLAAGEPSVPILLPGAFNPLHAGHRQMADIATRLLNVPVAFEISVHNVDKTDLGPEELAARIRQFRSEETVWITRADTFVKKSRIFPGTTFVVGLDTIKRLASTRYYGNDAAVRAEALQELRTRGCRFLVFGRRLAGRFLVLSDLQLPASLGDLCRGVSETSFRADISSTELRRANGASRA